MKMKVIDNIQINDKFSRCELLSDEPLLISKAGQFFMISCTDIKHSTDPILNRPFAISEITSPKSFSFIYMIVGKGTQLLREIRKDAEVNVTYPLGNYFKIEQNKKVAVVAGGIGIAPMLYLGKALREKNCNADIYYGGRKTSDILINDELSSTYDNLIVATEDGSLGFKGLVLKPIEEKIAIYDKIYACGPNRMLQAIVTLATAKNIDVEVSLDEQMGCGIGACLGCMIEMKTGASKRCCVEGPIFNGGAVDWSRLCS